MIDTIQNTKVITIVDCFISNNSVLTKLRSCLSNLKTHGHDILLISNSIPTSDVIEGVDYFLYNHQNKLFTNQYNNVAHCDLWKKYDNIVIHEITEEFQKHGLSVLCNLFNGLDLAKSLGYSHFQRVEVDDIYTESSYKFMSTVPELCITKNKESLFYRNEGKDVSFHYFYSNIDYFLNNFIRIKNEEDYKLYLKSFGHGLSFKPVEVYLYDNLNKIMEPTSLIKNGVVDMNIDFENTVWNTESSKSTLHEKYQGCTSKIYRIHERDGICVLTFNYNDYVVRRKIIVKSEDRQDVLNHNVEKLNSWVYNIYYDKIDKIEVYDEDTNELLYEIENKEIQDYIELI